MPSEIYKTPLTILFDIYTDLDIHQLFTRHIQEYNKEIIFVYPTQYNRSVSLLKVPVNFEFVASTPTLSLSHSPHYHFLSPTLPLSQSPTLTLSHAPTLSLSLTPSLSLSRTITLSLSNINRTTITLLLLRQKN